MKLLKYICCLLIIVGFASCSKHVDDVNKVLLKADLEASIFQDLKNDGRYLIQVSTIDSFECSNSFIISNSNFKDNTLDIVIEGVFIPQSCEKSKAILQAEHPFEINGENCAFSINIQDLYKVQGQIKMNQDSIVEVSLTEDPRIHFDHYRLNLIEDELLWFGVDLNNHLSDAILSKLRTALAPYLSPYQELSAGNYGYFEKTQKEFHIFKSKSKKTFNTSNYFRLREAITSNEHPAVKIIRELFKNNSELHDMEFNVSTGTGFDIL